MADEFHVSEELCREKLATTSGVVILGPLVGGELVAVGVIV